MKEYTDLLKLVLRDGTKKNDRTGTGTTSVFGATFRHDLARGFPLLTTKKIHTTSVIHELLWFLSGDTNIRYLKDNGVTIWNEWADENGDLGPVYGCQWRHFGDGYADTLNPIRLVVGIDQIAALVKSLRENPDSRRHIVTAWNPMDLPKQKLPPCHMMFQCNVRPHPLHAAGACDKVDCDIHRSTLDLQMYQRSADLFLGVPFNIASYALLTHILAVVTNLQPGVLSICFGDLHIYSNHEKQVYEQLARHERPLPSLLVHPFRKEIDEFEFNDFEFYGYNPHPAIKAPVAV